MRDQIRIEVASIRRWIRLRRRRSWT